MNGDANRLFRKLHLTRRRLVWVALAVVGGWLLVAVGLFVTFVAVGDGNDAEPSDVIIVLGAGLRRDGRAGDVLWRRSTRAADAYHEGLAQHIVCTGGVSEHQTRSEASACRELLLERGVPDAAIFLEGNSHSTEENALYTRDIMTQNGWTTAIVVSDSYHMFRASWIFSDLGIAHTRYPVPRNRIRWGWYASSLAREVAAVHWYAFKGIFGIEATAFPF